MNSSFGKRVTRVSSGEPSPHSLLRSYSASHEVRDQFSVLLAGFCSTFHFNANCTWTLRYIQPCPNRQDQFWGEITVKNSVMQHYDFCSKLVSDFCASVLTMDHSPWYLGPYSLYVIFPWKSDILPYSCLLLETWIMTASIGWLHWYWWVDLLAFLFFFSESFWRTRL